MYQVSDPNAEAFLIALLDDENFRFDALQSLGMTRAFGAAPSVARFVNDPNEHVRSMCLTTLGRLRYSPALAELVARLETVMMTAGATSRSVDDSNLEYELVGAIGKIGGDGAAAALAASISKLEHPEKAVLGLLYLKATPELRQLVLDGAVSAPTLVSALASKRLRGQIQRARPWIEDDVLLESALSEARKHHKEQRPHIVTSPYFAMAEFHMAGATEFLIEVAESDQDPGAGCDETPSPNLRDPAEEARMLLASNGIEPYSSRALENELDRIASKDYLWGHEIRHLVHWPRSEVRAALLKRLEKDDASASLLSTLEWFALSVDRAVFERHEQSPRIDIADVAHQYLEGD
jgi:hypothetical protein